MRLGLAVLLAFGWSVAGAETTKPGAAHLPHWRAALAAIRSAEHGGPVVHPRVIFGTDSTIAGGSGAGGTNIINLTYYVAKCLRDHGIRANDNGVMGTGPDHVSGTDFSRLDTDPRFFRGSWSQFIMTPGLGGAPMSAVAAGAPLVYQPLSGMAKENPIDTFEVYYSSWFPGAAFYGNFTATATGGFAVHGNGGNGRTNMTIDTAVATAPRPAAGNAVSLRWAGNGVLAPDVLGFDAYDAAVSSVQIFNAGVSGAVLAQWIGAFGYAADPLNALRYLAPTLTVLEFGPNDLAAGTSVATVRASLRTAIAAARLSGDVILMTWTPDLRNPGLTPAYLAMAKALATHEDIPIYDLNARWGTEPLAAARNFYVANDTDHPNSLGYADQAAGLCEMLLRP